MHAGGGIAHPSPLPGSGSRGLHADQLCCTGLRHLAPAGRSFRLQKCMPCPSVLLSSIRQTFSLGAPQVTMFPSSMLFTQYKRPRPHGCLILQVIKEQLLQHNDLSPFRSVTLRLSSSDETQIAPALQAVAQELTGQVSLGSYPVSSCSWNVLVFPKLTCLGIWLYTRRLVLACVDDSPNMQPAGVSSGRQGRDCPIAGEQVYRAAHGSA